MPESMDGKNVTIRIQRFNPDKDNKPYFDHFDIPLEPGTTVLDALHKIKTEIDGSVTYRRSCRHAICGSCAMGEVAEHPVDTQLRVKGVTGLRVADASVIPHIPVSAINAPSMMIGWRVADFILQQAKAEQQQKRSKTASTNNSKREAAEG